MYRLIPIGSYDSGHKLVDDVHSQSSRSHENPEGLRRKLPILLLRKGHPCKKSTDRTLKNHSQCDKEQCV